MNRVTPKGLPELLTLVLLAACSGPHKAPGAVAPPLPAPTSKVAPSRTTPPGPAGDSLAIAAAPAGAFERLQIAPGKTIGRTGIFFLRLADSSVEGWSIPGEDLAAQYSVSADGRWVSASSHDQHFLADRKTGAVYRWPRAAGGLLAAQGEHLLFAGAGRLWLAAGDPRTARAIALDVDTQHKIDVRFAPDGKTIAVLSGRSLYLLDADQGAVRQTVAMPDDPNRSVHYLGLASAPPDKGVVVVGLYSEQPARGARLWTYSWQGELQSDRQAPNWGYLSPDGSLIAWPDDHAGAEGSVLIGATADFQPRLRVLSANPCGPVAYGGSRWLADSSAMVIYTHGGYRLLRTDGTLAELPAFRGLGGPANPLPAPDRADRFALDGMRVVDSDGKELAAAVPSEPGKWIGVATLPWGESSDEARYLLYTAGKDTGCGGPMLAPRVERPPLPSTTALQVSVGQGDCVNLRADLDRKAPVLTCLPGGTRLVSADPPGGLNKGILQFYGNPLLTDMGGASWWHVRTPDGRRGWVLLDAAYLRWADPAPGADGDPLAGHIADGAANLRHWLRVATGEEACTVSCINNNAFAMLVDAAFDWCRGQLPVLTGDRAYSRERYGTALAPIEGACATLQSAGKWGDLKETPAWHQAVQEALAKLPA